MLRTDDLDYHLPDGRIATHAAEPRDAARLMVVRRSTGEIIEHAFVRDLGRFLRAGDCMVVNSSAVVRARLEGHREDTRGRTEGLYLGPARATGVARAWVCLLQGRRMRAGVRVVLHDREGNASPIVLRLLDRVEGTPGAWMVGVEGSLGTDEAGAGPPDVAILDAIGRTPLPPYIRRARERDHEHEDARTDDADYQRYQTVYARVDAAPASAPAATTPLTPTTPTTPIAGSVAAPTAGLHLTPELLERLSRDGVSLEEVVLHVGMGTFKPVESTFVEEHPMHREWCHVPLATRAGISRARASGGRVIAVGTTAARTLETFGAIEDCDESIQGIPSWIDTNLLITPGYAWRSTDALLTNFHLPRSTLLAMVAAMLDVSEPGQGIARLQRAYAEAIQRGYRFYSFGDAMLIIDDKAGSP